MTALAVSALTEQQRELVRCLVSEGRPPEEAAKLAGYHPKSVYRTLRLPAVAAAISESQPDTRTTERQLRDERRRQGERKARRIAAARAKQQIEVQTRREPGIMAFGGDGPNFFGN